MEEYYEEQDTEGRLYNREVIRLLFQYIFHYKRELLLSLVFILFITGVGIAVPYILRTMIDRYIFKQGRIVTLEPSRLAEMEPQALKRIRRGIYLSNNAYFLFRSHLNYFSKHEEELYIESGLFSRESYTLIELSQADDPLKKKIDDFVLQGKIVRFGGSLYLFESSILSSFTLNEFYRLRAWDFTRILLLFFFIVALLLVQFGATYLQIFLLMKLSQNAMRDLRKDLFSHILSLEVSYYDRNPLGKLVNRVTNDIETLNELFSSVLITLVQDLLLMVGVTVVMFITNIYLASVFALTVPFIVLSTILFRIQARKAYRAIRTKISILNSFLSETITGIRIVQIFVREFMNLRKFIERNVAVYKAQLKQLYVYAVFRPGIGLLRWLAVALVIYFGAKELIQGRLSYGLLLMFVAYIERFFAPVQDLSEKFDIMQSATAAGEKILGIFKINALSENQEGIREAQQRTSSLNHLRRHISDRSRFKGEIVFDDVWFSYNPGEWVLRGVSFSVNPKQTLAIVGETGAGKSTIISILSKFHPIQRGRILIDGKNIEDIPHWLIRRNIASVMQDVFLFSRDIQENITLDMPFDEEWFKKVCSTTHIERLLEKLPQGRREPIMERGANFSAGERQLLSFSRALYFNPSVLVLDEATSNIDTETEKLIQDAILHLTRGRTSLVIAHRLSTIRNADKIVVLDAGRIVEQGAHKQLLAKRGIYSQLYRLQFSTKT